MATILPFDSQRTASSAEEEQKTDALSKIHSFVATDMIAVNHIIMQRMESPVPLITELARYLIASGGKRLRPLLTLACAQLCGYEGARHHKLAAAVEFIHTATLLHDDVVDDSFLRRGNPSANATFGNQASVLVGDFLLSRAFQLMVEDGSLDILRILSNASATISEGEVLQLTTANDSTTSEQAYMEVIRAKTAELFAAACRIGAIVADQSSIEEEALRTYGLNLGIAFQIVDDVLDYSAKQTSLGKTIGDDFREGKLTLPVIIAIHRGTEDERAFWSRTLDTLDQQEDDLTTAQSILTKHNALGDSLERAAHYASVAKDSLGILPPSRIREALTDIVDFTVRRNF